MSPEAQRIAIAEACGWSNFEWNILLFGTFKNSNGYSWVDKEVPDYLFDLNAMFQAEKALTKEQKFKYVDELSWIMDVMVGSIDPIFAPAEQRAEAFLKTIGKWEARASSEKQTKEDE